MRRIIVIAVVMLLPLSSAFEIREWDRHVYYRNIILYAPAVAQAENGSYFGVLTEINVTMMNGSGNVFVITSPLTQLDMQGSARLAVDVAGMITGIDTSKYDFLFQVKADSPIVGGPSAGATMCIAAICLLEGMAANDGIIMTGMINPDGSIGPVGGILEKGEAAGKAGMKYFLIPKGQGIEYKVVEEKSGWVTFYRRVPVNVSEELYNKYGLIVKEVEDINDALVYFTNYSFEEEKLNKTIITAEYYREIMQPLAYEILQEANESYMDAQKAYNSAQIPVGSWLYNPKAIVANSLDNAEKMLNDAQLAYKNAFYYYSISKAFQSKINSLFVKYACSYYNGTSIQQIYDNVSKAVEKAVETAKKAEITGIVTLQCVGAAQQRALEARDYLNQSAQRSLDYLYYLAYAMERSNTVYWWLNLSKNFNESYDVNETWVKAMAEKYYDYAQNIFSYANILSEETGYSGQFVKKAGDLLDEAFKHKEEYPAASLFNSLESIANSNLAIEMIGVSKNEIYSKINRTSQMVSYAIEKARNMSIEPIMAVSYAEFGRSLENDDAVAALTYYKYAYMIANMLCLAKGYKVKKEIHKSNIEWGGEANNGNQNLEINWPIVTVLAFVIGLIAGVAAGRAWKGRNSEENITEEEEGIE
ncbi:MAG: hypothetical protein J7L58_01685 [Thermoplasmata archaeon]|nr:hypothetical protein [Thermoplasmata archaeon]